MKLIPSDPDIETIVSRIKSEDIDLQPDFQRGEVWSQPKQRRLIDSILRDWHIPPIHVVQQPDTKKQDVLDGQQRLAAIRDFVNGIFPVDGTIEPLDTAIQALNGLRYAELPPNWKRQFDQFTIRVFKIIDFEPEEPAELFFRLNQPVALTSAEQRNAFFGPIRTQVKHLVDELSKVSFGFSNSRMALDDVVARVCMSIENRSIAKKLTASQLTERYRAKTPFSTSTMGICETAVKHFSHSSREWPEAVKLNKATLFSWLWASACAGSYFADATPGIISRALSRSEKSRNDPASDSDAGLRFMSDTKIGGERYRELIQLFVDRSSSRVSDVSSVIARDVIIWMFIADACSSLKPDRLSQIPYIQILRNPVRSYLHDETLPASHLINGLIVFQRWGQLQ